MQPHIFRGTRREEEYGGLMPVRGCIGQVGEDITDGTVQGSRWRALPQSLVEARSPPAAGRPSQSGDLMRRDATVPRAAKRNLNVRGRGAAHAGRELCILRPGQRVAGL
jgi:hypothetical protein